MRWIGKWWGDLPPGVRRREIARMVEEAEDFMEEFMAKREYAPIEPEPREEKP